LEKWNEDVRNLTTTGNIPLLDLFYREQRMGNWGAVLPYAQDIAIEEISPLNNRELLLLFLFVPARRRLALKNAFFRRLLTNLWPATLSYPINPNDSGVKVYIKNHARLHYLAKKVSITAASQRKRIQP
jgi:hypothetical protein